MAFGINLGKWFKDRTDEVRDIFDANTAGDYARRAQQQQQRGQPVVRQTYAQQQIAQGNTRPYNNIGQQVFGNVSRLANTVASVPAEAYGTTRALSAMATGNQQALTNANKWNLAKDEVAYNPTGGLLRAGTIFDSAQQKRTASNLDALKRGAATGVGAWGEVVPVGKGVQLAAKGGQISKPAIFKIAGQGAAASAGADAGQQYISTGRIDPKQVAISAVTGAGLSVAPSVAKIGAQKAFNISAPTVQKGVTVAKNANESMYQTRLKRDAVYQDLVATQNRANAIASDPYQPAKIRKSAGEYAVTLTPQIRDRAQALRTGQGGYIRNPLAKPTPQVGKTSVITLERPPVKTKTQVAEPPQPPAKVSVQTMSPPPDGPNVGTKALPAGKTKKTKFSSKTVPESEYVSEGVKGNLKTTDYSPQTEKQGYTSALGRLKQEGDDVFEQKVNTALDKQAGSISRQEAIDAQTYAQILDTKGDDVSIQKASEIYDKLSDHYTAAGQTIQVASILSRRTPEGMRGWATRTLKKEGVKPTPQLQAQIVELSKQKKFTELAELVSKNIPSSTGDKIINFWRAGLLTAPTTTFGNLLGNTGELAVRKGFVNPVATIADIAMSKFTGKRTMTLAKPGQLAKGAKQGIKEFGANTDNTKYDIKRRTNYDTKVLDSYVNNVYKLMGVADKPYSVATTRESLSSIAKAEAINKGLKGAQRDKFVKDFIDNPPQTALERASQEGDFSVFKNPTTLGKTAMGAKKPLGPVGDFVVPFTQVPAAIATRIVTRTPIGTAQEVVKQIRHIKAGGEFDQRAMSQAIGNGAFGPAIMGVGYALANQDMLTFGYPTDNKERALWDEEGKQPYSVKIGDRWYSMNYLQPFGALLAIGGKASQAAKEGKDITDIVGQGAATAGQSIMNQSFLKGISGILGAVSDPERSVQNYVEQTSSSVVPNFIRSFARASDDIQRKPEGIVEGVKSGIPGLRDQTTPKYSKITGDPLPAKDNFVNQYVNPLKPSKVRETDLTAELRRLQDNELGVIPTQANKDMFGKDSGITDKQIKEVNSLVAKGISNEWKKIIADPRFKSLSDEDKKKVLAKVNDIVSPAVKADYAAKNNFISDKWEPKLNADQRAYLTDGLRDVLATTVAKPKTTKVAKSKSTRKSSGKRRKSISYQTISPVKKVTMGGAKKYSAPGVKISRPKRRVAKRTIRIKA